MKLRTIAFGCIVLGSSAAYAADHIAKVGEVMVSNQGSTTSQFIEIEDPAGESFPNGPYSLTLFDAAGVATGSVALTVPAGTTRLVVASAVAKTQFGLATATTLTVTLPANGQACFNRSSGRIHCLAWGTVTSQITGTSGNALGASPPDGMSLQLVSGLYAVGTPTPGATNSAALPDSSIDAGVLDSPLAVDAATADAPGGNGNNPSDDDDGCSVGAGPSWFAIVGLAALVLLRRRRA